MKIIIVILTIKFTINALKKIELNVLLFIYIL